MDEPSRSPYRLDLDNGPVFWNRAGSKNQAGFRRLRFSFFRQELAFSSENVCLASRRTYAWHRACSSGG
jgi:hypothetical protein